MDTFDLGPSAHFNSQVAATLGFINDYDSFLGYIDDVSATYLYNCYSGCEGWGLTVKVCFLLKASF